MSKSTEQDSLPAVSERRDFLKLAGGVGLAGAALAYSSGVQADGNGQSVFQVNPNWPDRVLWKKVRKAFALDKQTVYMNIGTTGSMPSHVLHNYERYNRLVAREPWDMGGEWGGWPYLTELVKDIAPQFGARADEIVLSRNTTDGMCTVLGGLNLKPGDEILTTHHEHVAAVSPLKLAAQRYGVVVRYLDIPVFPQDAQEYVDVFAAVVSVKTRLIVFSHITYKTGARLPAQAICAMARDHGIPTLVDGAHSIGMLDLDLHAMDCDFYAGSGHKWQCGPGATGILYVRDNMSRLNEYWTKPKEPELNFYAINSSLHHYAASFGWHTALQYIGNDNYPAKRALSDSCSMWRDIGRGRIEERILDLGALCKSLISDSFDEATLFSPDVPGLTSGLTSFNPFPNVHDGNLPTLFRDRLREEYGYIIRTTDFHVHTDDPMPTYALRISTHLFHDEADVVGLIEAMAALYQDMS